MLVRQPEEEREVDNEDLPDLMEDEPAESELEEDTESIDDSQYSDLSDEIIELLNVGPLLSSIYPDDLIITIPISADEGNVNSDDEENIHG